MNDKPAYPKGFVTPDGRAVSRTTMARAIKAIRKAPHREYTGWNWYPTPGYQILNGFREGLRDRIKQRRELRNVL